jgi:hypothetical protein
MSLRWLVVAASLSAACVGTRTYRVLVGNTAAPHQGRIALFLNGARAPDAFEEVAVVQAVGGDMEHVVTALQREAAQLGCDAIVNMRIDQGSSVTSATGMAVRLHSPQTR